MQSLPSYNSEQALNIIKEMEVCNGGVIPYHGSLWDWQEKVISEFEEEVKLGNVSFSNLSQKMTEQTLEEVSFKVLRNVKFSTIFVVKHRITSEIICKKMLELLGRKDTRLWAIVYFTGVKNYDFQELSKLPQIHSPICSVTRNKYFRKAKKKTTKICEYIVHTQPELSFSNNDICFFNYLQSIQIYYKDLFLSLFEYHENYMIAYVKYLNFEELNTKEINYIYQKLYKNSFFSLGLLSNSPAIWKKLPNSDKYKDYSPALLVIENYRNSKQSVVL
ncbi:hypothetical protein ACE193_23660 [Bernardetia sp. OM2101]|uniref:hypothetical protein n=1 Tax=Bernardetia sp. OM2101 TaxID=3344876 RepID=UPI0035D12A6E